jgi:hypothetical protein
MTVLSYPLSRTTFSQAVVAAGQRCFFASDTLCPIFRLVPNGRLTSWVTCRWFCCNDMTHLFAPLLGQSHKWRILWDQALDQLHDSLELNGIEVWVEVPDNFVARCPSVGRFRSPDGWVSVGIVVGRRPAGTHHADAASLNDRITIDVVPNLRGSLRWNPDGWMLLMKLSSMF